ncbi:MAG: hypothetical protein U0350_15410 [Caldilineaceae bacterium]
MSDSHSTYSLQELLRRWKRDEITVEQLAGYLLQHVLRHEQRLDQLEQAHRRAQAGPPPTSDNPKQP